MSRQRKRPDGSFWAERMIRDGKVRAFGKTYRVEPLKRPPEIEQYGRAYQSQPPYDGRLDGHVGYFAHYGPSSPNLADSIWLEACGAESLDEWPGLNCIDGYFVWERWREIA